jgi:hypothetical protein
MTRRSLSRKLRGVYVFLGVIIVIALLAKIADHLGFPRGGAGDSVLKDVYEFLKDMSLLIATGGVAYVTNIFQQRHAFIESLREEWRDIIAAKSALFAFTQTEQPTPEQYLAAFCKLSETIDNMRIVYKNVGETDALIGLYPYAPLHDMRRVLQTLEPRKNPAPPEEERKLARDAILSSFYALRETFLEELDLEEPTHPLLIFGGRRTKRPGTTGAATGAQTRQRARQDKMSPPDPEIAALQTRLYDKEHATPKAWRQIEGGVVEATRNGEARR